MAIPTNYIKKRDLLFSEKSTPAQLSKIAREFLAAERYSDALDFFERARDQQGLAEIKQIAQNKGDTFLLARLVRFDHHLVSEFDWGNAAQVAARHGRQSMADFVARKFTKTAASAPAQPVLPGAEPLAEG